MKDLPYLAFDFGAGSGRAILGTLGKKIELQEIHRFDNPQIRLLNHLHWDLPHLFNELKKGLIAARHSGCRELAGIGVDTWGVDFGLIGERQTLLGHPVCYRDLRTEGMMEAVFQRLPARSIYEYTGIQFLSFNTLYQLYHMAQARDPLLEISRRLLFMPDMMNLLMTGEAVSEHTIASTSQLLNARTGAWAPELFDRLGLPLQIMPPLLRPGTVIGSLLPTLACEVDLPRNTEIIATAGHDTACAVVAVPAVTGPGTAGGWAYLSSGTWSLVGIESVEPIITDASFAHGFTNEGGVNGTFRILRNVMGMWLLEQCRAQWLSEGKNLSHADLIALAEQSRPFACFIDPDHTQFLNPPDMAAAIAAFCINTGQTTPSSRGALVRCILESLALKYRYCLEQLQALSKTPIRMLHIVGGGSRNDLLNRFTADAAGLHVMAGPVEATALGNLLVQAMARGQLTSVAEGRRLIAASFDLRHYQPGDQGQWNEAYARVRPWFTNRDG